MTKPQTTAVVVVLIAAIALTVFQYQSAEKLRAEKLALQAQNAEISRLAQENAGLSNSLAQARAPQLSRDQTSELLRLRAQAGQLKRDLAAARATPKSPLTIQKLDEVTSPDDDATKPFTAEFTSHLPNGHALLTGGWSATPGVRTFILVTTSPFIAPGSTTARTMFQSTFFEVPETLLAQLRLDQSTSDTRQSSVQNVLAAADSKALLDALQTTDGVKILSQPRAVTENGQEARAGMSWGSTPNGDGPSGFKTIQFTPNFAADGSGIDLAVKAALSPPPPAPGGN